MAEKVKVQATTCRGLGKGHREGEEETNRSGE